MSDSQWDRRIRRANQLAAEHPFAAEAMLFYSRLAGFQKALYAHFESACGSERKKRPPGSLRNEMDLFVLLPKFREFLACLEPVAPGPIARTALELQSQNVAHWQHLLASFWETAASSTTAISPDPAVAESVATREAVLTDSYFAWIFLQPYAEYLADHTEALPASGAPAECPLCSGKPQAGVLRPEGDGAKRSLVCSLCATEWSYRRLICPACGEENAEKLALYVADRFEHIRVEACDSCRHYIKTVDLTKNGRAVPVVDELAAIPLDLWAGENGYAKWGSNLLGM